ncbi:unnamed protein product [[Actinomadura] parvosata subsp. kistnae]|nr:unnamed protein product [Actinomadura parvosata subsp. kistnae]
MCGAARGWKRPRHRRSGHRRRARVRQANPRPDAQARERACGTAGLARVCGRASARRRHGGWGRPRRRVGETGCGGARRNANGAQPSQVGGCGRHRHKHGGGAGRGRGGGPGVGAPPPRHTSEAVRGEEAGSEHRRGVGHGTRSRVRRCGGQPRAGLEASSWRP